MGESAPTVGTSFECVLNVSEGRRIPVIDEAVAAGADTVLDVHTDPVHNRSVLTLGGPLEVVEEAARRVVTVAVTRIDLRDHSGVHPRFGAADVVPFVAPSGDWAEPPPGAVVAARDRFARWAGSELGLPCFLYGPERSLPEVRRDAFRALRPDTGPSEPHPTAGACAVGARPVLIAYNIWITRDDFPHGGSSAEVVQAAGPLAAGLRSKDVRALAFPMDVGAQLSFNLVGPGAPPLGELFDTVARGAEADGWSVERAELVGLVPEEVLRREPRDRWAELDLAEDRTIEARMALKGHEVSRGRR